MVKTETKIGKDVIESLTEGMYEDSRFIYREYIQNCADQIDTSVEEGLFSSSRDGNIEIDINQTAKSISIYDNATGIESNKVESILKNIANSTKDRAKNKGFRGIGRLGGLAYCQKLIFETSFKGEESKSYLIWDSQKLKTIINDRSKKEEAANVVDEVTKFISEKEKKDAHYFKVTLQGVSKQDLLDKDAIYQYLTMVAPAPYKKGFLFKNKIDDKAKELNFNIDEYSIFVNKNQIFKEYTSSIYEGENNNKRKIDEIHDIETYEIRSSKNKLLAWGWYSISTLTKQMPKINIGRGIRLRKGNIQIGSEDTLNKLFNDARWSKYFFGEVHTVSPELIPNARRDYFLENATVLEFEKIIKNKFNELQKLNYLSSNIRSEKKKIDDFNSFSIEYEEKFTKGGFTNDKERDDFKEKFEAQKEKAKSAEEALIKTKEKLTDQPNSQKIIYEKIIGNKESNVEKVIIGDDNEKTKYITDSLTALNRKDRKLVSRIFAVIDNVLPKDIANVLKEKIKEEMQ